MLMRSICTGTAPGMKKEGQPAALLFELERFRGDLSITHFLKVMTISENKPRTTIKLTSAIRLNWLIAIPTYSIPSEKPNLKVVEVMACGRV